MDLVVEICGEPRTSTEIIAKGVAQPHRSVIQLARKYMALLNEFGRVQFEIAPFASRGGTQRREIALLNERQATFLITLMRNTEKVVEFKFKLVKQFFVMTALLARRAEIAVRREFLNQRQAASLETSRPFGAGLAKRRVEKITIENELAQLDMQFRLAF